MYNILHSSGLYSGRIANASASEAWLDLSRFVTNSRVADVNASSSLASDVHADQGDIPRHRDG